VSYDVDSYTATFTPSAYLDPGVEYKVEVGNEAEDEAGNGIVTEESWIFTTEEYIYRLSVSTDGMEGNGQSYNTSISADGRYVAFSSEADNLVSGDTNVETDVFVHDTQTGDTVRISVNSDGNESDGYCYRPCISADGRYVAFHSNASNLITGDTNGAWDVFIHDTQASTTTRVSVASDKAQGLDNSEYPSISADGRFVAFDSSANNLVDDDTNSARDIFVNDTLTGDTTRVSVASDTTQGNGASELSYVNADGRFIAFVSVASNLVAGDTNGTNDIFIHDIQTGETKRVSVASDTSQSNGDSYRSSISSDGRYVVFDSDASNLVAGDTNGVKDIFVHDTNTGSTTRVSVNSDAVQGNGISEFPFISTNGRYLAFISSADNLVVNDTNGVYDIFRVLNR